MSERTLSVALNEEIRAFNSPLTEMPSSYLGGDAERSNDSLSGITGQLLNSIGLMQAKVAQLSNELEIVSAQKDFEIDTKNRITTRLCTLLDFLPGGVVVLDCRGFIVQSNPAARALLNSTLDGMTWREIATRCFVSSAQGLEVLTQTGRCISVATASLKDEGQIILLTDQTETRRLQQQVNQHDKLSAMGKMVSALAHQIRTPLSAAILYANHLCAETITEDRRKIFSKKLLGRLNHLAQQVKDMLLFVRNELPLNNEVTLENLELGLRAAMEVPLATSKSRCIWENAIPLAKVRCNREALISAILNLVDNAIQASSGAAKLKISFCKTAINAEPAVALAVADNGPGMSTQELNSVQQAFYTTKPQGTGLGLAVVRSIALAHGGQFKLHSRSGVGTCAVLLLPLADPL